MKSWTISDVISRLDRPQFDPLPKPGYTFCGRPRKIALAVESMQHHMTDEGWQLMLGLEAGGYELCGRSRGLGTNVPGMLRGADPGVVVMQDKREWEGRTAGAGFDEAERFQSIGILKAFEEVFKVTVLKDAQNDPVYHRHSADEIGCHAWIVYYHPRIVAHVAPYVRQEHLLRTYHSVDPWAVPEWVHGRERGAIVLSGAVSNAYPLRKRLRDSGKFLSLTHPGYGRSGCHTPNYLNRLSKYKVSICTASRYGYALRKIIESTAVGCRVVTDLPMDDELPYIDGNLIRVHNDATPEEVLDKCQTAADSWDEDARRMYAEAAQRHYSYRYLGQSLSKQIDDLRKDYDR